MNRKFIRFTHKFKFVKMFLLKILKHHFPELSKALYVLSLDDNVFTSFFILLKYCFFSNQIYIHETHIFLGETIFPNFLLFSKSFHRGVCLKQKRKQTTKKYTNLYTLTFHLHLFHFLLSPVEKQNVKYSWLSELLNFG